MSARKKSATTTDESSSGSSSSDSTSSSGSSSGSGSGSSSSESESTSSADEKQAPKSAEQSKTQTGGTNRRKSSESKGQNKSVVAEEKASSTSVAANKSKAQNVRGQRLSKSSICSSDDEVNIPSSAKRLLKRKLLGPADRRKIDGDKKPIASEPTTTGGGKAPPAVVKQHHQQQHLAKNKQVVSKPPPRSAPLSKTVKSKATISTTDSSDSEEEKSPKKAAKPAPKNAVKSPIKAVAKHVKTSVQKKPPTTAKKAAPSDESESESSSGSDDNTSSSSNSDSESSGRSSPPPTKRPPPPKKTTTAKVPKPVTDVGSKAVVLSDSDSPPGHTSPKNVGVRKLTRSSSTRKSKHLLGKASETESDMDVDKRSQSRSPAKKASVNVTKSKAKVKRDLKLSNSTATRADTPPPEDLKCPVEGCDSSGHLSGNQETHFLQEACPTYHNMSASECKDRAIERKMKKEEYMQAIVQSDASKKLQTPEQKAYLSKIRENRARFKPPSTTSSTGDKIKTEKDCDIDRESNLVGLVPDYDLQMFREAQAIASEGIENEVRNVPVGKGIRYITMGKYQMKVWYQSPYPDDTARLPKMYICEYCLRYQKSETGIKRHAAKCVWRHPPGDEIYRKGKLQVWQVDGKRYKQYCQHLCLLAKFFLDHKTLYYDVEPFLFYVMTLADADGCHTVGYFSKEKNSFYNVSCILTLPPYQRKGYGRLLIDFSYLLTRVEGKIGSPEKPLSDLGLISYRSYWKDVLLDYLCTRTGTTLSIKDLSQEMAIYSYDIVSTLQALGMMKYWKGKHIVLKKQDVLEEFTDRVKRHGNFPRIDAACLRWSPFVPTSSPSE